MKKTQTSTTAQGIAFIRAFETSKPPDVRICNDPYARQFINPFFYLLGRLFASYSERVAPGVIGFLVARCRHIDDYLQACLDADIRQVVILGAGLDSRAYRFALLQYQGKVYEVDQPATQQAKKTTVKKVLGELPSHVAYVPVDFNHETLQKLYDFGYNRQLRTLFIWEGVTHYLQPAAVDQTLAFVRANSAPDSTIIFDYVYSSALVAQKKRGEITRMHRSARFTGEELVFGIEEGEVGAFLSERGYDRVVNVTSQELEKQYFTGANAGRKVAPIYAIVHAVVSATV